MAEPQGTISADDPSPAIPPAAAPQAVPVAAGGDAPGNEEDGSSVPGEEDGDMKDEDEDDDDDNMLYDSDDPFSEPSDCHASPQAMHRHNSFREPLVPLDCGDCEQALQHFVQVFEERYGEYHPHFYIGTLENAVKEVTEVQNPQQLKPLLIFVHNDRSVMAHVFCSSVLCSQVIVEYLNANFLVWPWDITHKENRDVLLAMVEECFDEEPSTDSGDNKDHSFKVQKPLFTQPQLSRYQRSSLWPKADNVTPKSVLEQLTSKVDDLPACLMFYPVAGQPHSIHGTWVASKGMSDSFLMALESCIEDLKVLSMQSPQQHTCYDRQSEERLFQQVAQTSHDTYACDLSQDQPVDKERTNNSDGLNSDELVCDNLEPDEELHRPVNQDAPVNPDSPAINRDRPVSEDIGTPVDPLETTLQIDTPHSTDRP